MKDKIKKYLEKKGERKNAKNKTNIDGKIFFLLHFISPFDIVNDNDSQPAPAQTLQRENKYNYPLTVRTMCVSEAKA